MPHQFLLQLLKQYLVFPHQQKTINIDGENDDVDILARERWPSLEYEILDSELVRDCADAEVGLDRNESHCAHDVVDCPVAVARFLRNSAQAPAKI